MEGPKMQAGRNTRKYFQSLSLKDIWVPDYIFMHMESINEYLL